MKKSYKKKEEQTKRYWSEHEDEVLVSAVQSHGPFKWSDIAKIVGTRTGKQCRERYLDHLDPNLKSNSWTSEEDKTIIEGQKENGNSWSTIASLLTGRTPNAVKNHWYSTLQKKESNKKRKRKTPVEKKSKVQVITKEEKNEQQQEEEEEEEEINHSRVWIEEKTKPEPVGVPEEEVLFDDDYESPHDTPDVSVVESPAELMDFGTFEKSIGQKYSDEEYDNESATELLDDN